jgi:5-methyltetrahydrofolate--homocysteine methyltransferase
MADDARLAVDAGARIIGGCCGTTPEIVRAMRNALDTHTRDDAPSLDTVERRLGVLTAGAKSGNGANRAAQAAARRSTRRRR